MQNQLGAGVMALIRHIEGAVDSRGNASPETMFTDN